MTQTAKRWPSADFQECDECAAKPGSPILCNDCIRRRNGTQTALDRFADDVRRKWPHRSHLGLASLDAVVRHVMLAWTPYWTTPMLQDPRYLAYCQEQDRKEEPSLAGATLRHRIADACLNR